MFTHSFQDPRTFRILNTYRTDVITAEELERIERNGANMYLARLRSIPSHSSALITYVKDVKS